MNETFVNGPADTSPADRASILQASVAQEAADAAECLKQKLKVFKKKLTNSWKKLWKFFGKKIVAFKTKVGDTF